MGTPSMTIFSIHVDSQNCDGFPNAIEGQHWMMGDMLSNKSSNAETTKRSSTPQLQLELLTLDSSPAAQLAVLGNWRGSKHRSQS
jgi:hypothetical protein